MNTPQKVPVCCLTASRSANGGTRPAAISSSSSAATCDEQSMRQEFEACLI